MSSKPQSRKANPDPSSRFKTYSVIGKCRRCKKEYERQQPLQRICEECKNRCSSCEVTLNEENWDKTGRKYRNQYRCKKCVASNVKTTKGNKGFNQREYDLKRNYGLSLEQYDDLLKKQNYRCAVCQKHRDDMKINMAVDHDHKTGEIFGLLCTYCNKHLIGRQRNPEIFLSAAKFLEKGTGLFVPKDRPKKKKRRRRRSKKKGK